MRSKADVLKSYLRHTEKYKVSACCVQEHCAGKAGLREEAWECRVVDCMINKWKKKHLLCFRDYAMLWESEDKESSFCL